MGYHQKIEGIGKGSLPSQAGEREEMLGQESSKDVHQEETMEERPGPLAFPQK